MWKFFLTLFENLKSRSLARSSRKIHSLSTTRTLAQFLIPHWHVWLFIYTYTCTDIDTDTMYVEVCTLAWLKLFVATVLASWPSCCCFGMQTASRNVNNTYTNINIRIHIHIHRVHRDSLIQINIHIMYTHSVL